MKKVIFALMILCLICLSCSLDSITSPEKSLVVIQAFVYAGEPVGDVRLTSTLPLGSIETSAPPINNASVYIIKNQIRYQLVLSPGDSGYYHYPGSDLTINAGDVLSIEVEYYGGFITATTVVPSPPQEVTLSSDTLIYPTMTEPQSFNPIDFEKSRLTLRWENNDNSLFYVTVENVDSNPIPVNESGLTFRQRISFISRPTSGDSMRISFSNIIYLGRHRAKIYKINQEYANLYYTQNQDSRDLNEPLTNVKNGLGVFSAFNSASVFFEVKY